ncbi:MAG: ChaN family lipoprotein [Pseudomonadota bacterium]
MANATDNRSAPPLPLEWQAEKLRDHPLVGKIYDPTSGAFVSADALAKALALARFPLLGEIHDNPDHHLWQAWGIRAISKLRGSRIVEGAPQIDMIAMEMLSVDQYEGIDKFYGRNARVPRVRKPRAFGRIVKWKESGWPDFKIYEPIIAQAQYEQIVVAPASPTREANRGVSQKGLEGYLGAGEVSRLALIDGLPANRQDALLQEIEDSHCGLMPKQHFPRMADVQRYRDAVMADALLSPGNEKGAILIAGNGHVRRDRGVAVYLEARGAATQSIVAVGKVEVVDDEVDPSAYTVKTEDGTPLYDFVVFTPRVDREDPCVRMKAMFERIKKSSAAKKATTDAAPDKKEDVKETEKQ